MELRLLRPPQAPYNAVGICFLYEKTEGRHNRLDRYKDTGGKKKCGPAEKKVKRCYKAVTAGKAALNKDVSPAVTKIPRMDTRMIYGKEDADGYSRIKP